METAQTGMWDALVKSQLLLRLHAVQQEEVISGEAGNVVCQSLVERHAHVYLDEWSM